MDKSGAKKEPEPKKNNVGSATLHDYSVTGSHIHYTVLWSRSRLYPDFFAEAGAG